MKQTAKEREQGCRAQVRLRVLHHYEQMTRNVSQTCRFFGISRTLFYRWEDSRHQRHPAAVARSLASLPVT